MSSLQCECEDVNSVSIYLKRVFELHHIKMLAFLSSENKNILLNLIYFNMIRYKFHLHIFSSVWIQRLFFYVEMIFDLHRTYMVSLQCVFKVDLLKVFYVKMIFVIYCTHMISLQYQCKNDISNHIFVKMFFLYKLHINTYF